MLVIRPFISILKPAPAADVIDQNGFEIRLAGSDLCHQVLQRLATVSPQPGPTGVAGVHAELLSSRANNLLGQIMEFLEKDVPAAWDVTERFKSAATERFGKKFPKFNLDLEQK